MQSFPELGDRMELRFVRRKEMTRVEMILKRFWFRFQLARFEVGRYQSVENYETRNAAMHSKLTLAGAVYRQIIDRARA